MKENKVLKSSMIVMLFVIIEECTYLWDIFKDKIVKK
ncbi:MAG: hypothetical protein ACI8WT_002267 [Clostridium sp.]|jgi:hypothetical protein